MDPAGEQDPEDVRDRALIFVYTVSSTFCLIVAAHAAVFDLTARFAVFAVLAMVISGAGLIRFVKMLTRKR
jgi:hypothetical protein